MSKIMFADGQMAIIAGVVKSVKDEQDKFGVAIEYDGYNSETKTGEKKTTYVYFRNQDAREDGKESIPYADRARKMKPRNGSSVIAYIRFTDDERKFANGYGFKYDGKLSMKKGDGDNEKLYTVVKGLVTRVTKKTNSVGEEYLSLSVYTGKDKDGNFMNEHINMRSTEKNPKLMESAEKVLSPRTDGTKLSAAFLCGAPYETATNEGDDLTIYNAWDFSVTGQKAANN